MAFYVKVTPAVATALKLKAIRNKTADGNYLLWQADLNSIQGVTIFERAANVGGVALTPNEAKREIDGVNNPASVYTPDRYKSEEEIEAQNNAGGATEVVEEVVTEDVTESAESEDVVDETSEEPAESTNTEEEIVEPITEE